MTRSFLAGVVRSAMAGALAGCAAVGTLAGCTSAAEPRADTSAPDASPLGRDAGIGISIDSGLTINPSGEDLGASCDPTRSVRSDGAALIVRDPAALATFSLERVVTQLLATAGASALTPKELLQRLFDTSNSTQTGVFGDNDHCDDAKNEAFRNGAPIDCPRAEGALATSATLLTNDGADSFVPVAIVNRFDLAPQTFETCGEFRIVFAKQSGRTDPDNRLLMIFEGVLSNPTAGIAGCRPVAEFWAGLEGLPSAAERAARLEQFLFVGLPGFDPLVHAKHFGIDRTNCGYVDCGQLRMGLGMQAPWDFREFRLQRRAPLEAGPECHFAPVTVKNSAVPGLFDPASTDPKAEGFRSSFVWWAEEVSRATTVSAMRVALADVYNAGQSALAGAARPNFVDRVGESDAGAAFITQISETLANVDFDCPVDDPITYESAFQRVTALTCAGCHAPAQLLSPTRGLGCGLVWPNSLGEAHIDENGELSEALVEILLPHRADVLSTYLQACDASVIRAKFQPVPQACFVAGTPITMADGKLKPIEEIVPGDLVLAFDETRSALVPGEVTRAFVHPNSVNLVVVNETLVATANHPIYSRGDWVRADSLAQGSSLLTAIDADPTSGVRLELTSGQVRQLEMRKGVATTYNFEVAVHHDYFAGGVLVHNKK